MVEADKAPDGFPDERRLGLPRLRREDTECRHLVGWEPDAEPGENGRGRGLLPPRLFALVTGRQPAGAAPGHVSPLPPAPAGRP